MSKRKKQFSCSNCGYITIKWSGQCTQCKSWDTIEEELVNSDRPIPSMLGVPKQIESLDDNVQNPKRITTGIEELNKVLGGGLVEASVVLIGGDPGIGKSTLLLQIMSDIAKNNINALYVTGEESLEQIKLRAIRLNVTQNNIQALSETNVEDIISTISVNGQNIKLLIIDSIQTLYTKEIGSTPGTVSQIKAAAHMLINYTKQSNIALLLACHVNKEGQIAGPKLLEHAVDTVLYFEGDRNNHFRILRSIKNRFGGANEIGIFEMTASGLIEVPNPGAMFLQDRLNHVSGSAVFAGIEGSRPLLIEVQCLITNSNMPMPRRSVVGWDINRLSMILAVLNARFGLNLSSYEVYLTIADGFKISDPAVDVAVAAAIISAAVNKPIGHDVVFFGEIGLSGEIRSVPQIELRVKESKKLGFDKIVCFNSNNKNNLINSISHIKQLKEFI
ncbi:MAG: DNA repair protein RadA [Rickettsiaceae bacterium]